MICVQGKSAWWCLCAKNNSSDGIWLKYISMSQFKIIPWALPLSLHCLQPLYQMSLGAVYVTSFSTDSGLLGYDAGSLGERFLAFWGIVVPSSSRVMGCFIWDVSILEGSRTNHRDTHVISQKTWTVRNNALWQLLNVWEAVGSGQSDNDTSHHSSACGYAIKCVALFCFRCLREMVRSGCVFFWLVECVVCVIEWCCYFLRLYTASDTWMNEYEASVEW
jgi:hypothetical protein